MKKIEYQNLPNCIQLTNGEIEVVLTTDVGPRIVSYSFVEGENILGWHADARVETALGEWKPYGGHRLWIAPENMPNSYAPDNEAVEYSLDEQKNSVHLVQPIEAVTKTRKEMTVTLEKSGSGVSINHKITNCGTETTEIAAWALTIMRGGGEVLIPNEPFAPYSRETLLPVRNLSLWSYTDLSDSRWSFDRDFIRLQVDEKKTEPQKIGVLNKQGWIKYNWQNLTFTKNFDFLETVVYPDMNSNAEIYTAGSFIEIESLSPLQKLASGDSIRHKEYWHLSASSK